MPQSGTIASKRPVRRMNSANRRQEIVNAAFDSIAATGQLSLSTTDLATKVGISQPAIFRHFRSKQQLHDAILAEANNHILTHLKKLIGQTERWQNPSQLIKDILVTMGKSFCKDPGIWLTLIHQRCLSGEEFPTCQGMDKMQGKSCASTQLHYSLKRLCGSAIETGQLSRNADPESLSCVLVALLFGVGQQWIGSGKSFDMIERLSYAADGFLDGHLSLREARPAEQTEVALARPA